MFAKQAQFAVAALTLVVAGGAFAQTADRNVFDSEAILSQPVAVSAAGVTREAVQAEYIAKRNAENISSFNPESYYFKQIAGAGSGFLALFQSQRDTQVASSADGVTRAQVRAELLAARANGEIDQFNTETVAYVMPAKARTTRVAQASK
jgi:hypothetical protein